MYKMTPNYFILSCTLIPLLSLSEVPSPASTPSCSYHHTTLRCRGLNTTADILDTDRDTAQSVIRVEVSDSRVACLEWRHFSRFQNLQEIELTNSELKQVMCGGHKVRHKKAVHHLRYLRYLNLSSNALTDLDDSITVLHHLEMIDLSNNTFLHIKCDFSNFKKLKYLDISNNNLTSLNSLPASISHLNLSGNLLTCSPTLSWLSPWSLGLSSSLRAQLDLVQCYLINSRQVAPLLQIMKYYTDKVNPFCPPKCRCYFYHFSPRLDTSPSYTLLVNCSMQGLTTFPTLPPHTTIVDLSHNNLSDSSFSSLSLTPQHYDQVTGMILSHNQLTSINTKLTKMRLHRVFKADHNQITEIPYDFSLLLQSFAKTKITLGHNQWRCRCNAEILSLSLLAKLVDSEDVTCSEGQNQERLGGQKVLELDPFTLCPPSAEGREKEQLLQVICLVLAVVNMFVFSKLLYDYHKYKNTGKLPGIIYWIPCL